MLKFRSYLQEMAYSPDSLNQITNTLASIVSKKVGKLYRAGGNEGTVEYTNASGTGTGILFFSDSLKALRFNLNPAEQSNDEISVTSVDFWKKYQFDPTDWSDNTPDVNLHVPAGINAVKLAELIIATFKNMTVGAVNEAVRVSGPEFAQKVKDTLGTTNVSFAQMKDVAAKHGVNVPMVARSTKAGKDLYALGSLLTKGTPEKLKVPSSVARAEVIAKKANISVDELFEDLGALTKLVVKGKRPSLVITGQAGTGKTFTVMKEISDGGLVKNKDWVVTKGKVSPYGIYSTLYMNRTKLIVFDDSDDVFATPEAKNILKAALDSYSERIVSWVSKSTINISGKTDAEKREICREIDLQLASGDTETKLPSEFDFEGRIIFISNLEPHRIDAAILSRSLTIDIQLSPADIFKKMEKLLPEVEPDVPLKLKKEVLAFLIDSHKKDATDKLPSMRTLVAGINIASSGMKNWHKLMKYT